MKKLIFIAICLFAVTDLYGQADTSTTQSIPPAEKCFLAGTISDSSRKPLKGTEIFVYQADSAIVGSGYTDESGYFKTNSLEPGIYSVKIVYVTKTSRVVTGIRMQPGINMFSISALIPARDVTIPYSELLDKAKSGK